MNNNDTIFALSSGHGKSGVAVIRISGDNLHDTFSKFISKSDFSPRHAYFCNLHASADDLIDQCLAIYFPAPHSFTGTDIIELHTHGAPATINAVFEYLKTLGMRMATPGEFSRRAFYNNKMDLADIDGLAALLDAQTDNQRKHALRSMLGHDSQIYSTWREQMVEISAYAAAILDYNSDDLPANITETIMTRTHHLHTEISNALAKYKTARAIRGGINIVLCGQTNAGKSSIFNYLVGANRAIVSDIAGTTRDVVSVNLDLEGFLVNLSDTAGIRETDDEIENIGIERTKKELENADIILNVFTPETTFLYKTGNDNLATESNIKINIVNKSDTSTDFDSRFDLYVSAKTGDGMPQLLELLRTKIHEITDGAESGVSINARTHALLEQACSDLNSAIKSKDNFDIFAEHTRRAADAIGKILGTITTTEVLDKTFGQLGLGK